MPKNASGIFNFNGHSYQLISTPLMQTAAQSRAESLGGKLAEIGSMAENTALLAFANAEATRLGINQTAADGGIEYFWIGLTDTLLEGRFITFSGRLHDWFNWGDLNGGVPDDWQGQDGVALANARWSYGTRGQWNDLDQSAKLLGIVEFDDLRGGRANDWLAGSVNPDMIRGFDGRDTLVGGAGSDSLEGGFGADRLVGGAGADMMNGGVDGSRDTFVIAKTTDSSPTLGRDRITGFVEGIDLLDLRGIDANTRLAGNQAFAFSDETPRANSLWWEEIGGTVFLRGDVNGNRVAEFEVRLDGLMEISAVSILL